VASIVDPHLEPLSEPNDAVTEAYDVKTRDGVSLSTDLYLPTATTPAPTVLIRTPYDKGARAGFKPRLAMYLADCGYAVVVQDVRGRGRSSGTPSPYVHEAPDGYDAIEWIVRQPWSNGAVGMVGGSYAALAQWAAASSGHAALRAIAPDGIAVNCDYPLRFQGVPWLEHYRWFVDAWTFQTLIKTDAWGWTERPLMASIPDWAARGRELLESWITGATDLAYHLGRVFPDGVPTRTLRIPALHATGWWDTFARFGFTDWEQVRTSAPAAEHQYLRLRAADHHYPYLADGRAPADHWSTDDAALERMLPDLMREPLDFMESYLRGDGPTSPCPRVKYELANGPSGVADRWPPAGTRTRTLHLTAAEQALSSLDGGGLVDTPETTRQRARWEHDPARPVPSMTASEWDVLLVPQDQSDNHLRPDVLTFTSDAQDGPLDLCGPALAALAVGGSASSTHVMTELSDVAPSGRAQLIAYGASYVRLEEGPSNVGVDLGMTGYRLRPGHRLRLAVSSSMFPRFPVHPGTSHDPLYATAYRVSEQFLHLGGDGGSRLHVTVADQPIS
jgi:predicted acyl esterase